MEEGEYQGYSKFKVYISAPISGRPLEERKEFFRRVESYLRARSINYINPLAQALKELGPNRTHEEYMRFDLQLLLRCDVILLCPGWECSPGCRMEFEVAMATGIKARYFN